MTTSHQVQGTEVKPVSVGKLSSETDTGPSWPSPSGLSTLRYLSPFQVTKDSRDHQDPKVYSSRCCSAFPMVWSAAGRPDTTCVQGPRAHMALVPGPWDGEGAESSLFLSFSERETEAQRRETKYPPHICIVEWSSQW